MAGLWERVKRSDDDNADRINIHLVVAGLKGHASGIYTANQVISTLNNHLRAAMTANEQNDLQAIANQIDAKVLAIEKLAYVVGKLEPSMVAAETGDIDEAKWRGDLGI